MDPYTYEPKPTSSTYTYVNFEGKQIYDQTDVIYDDPNTFYDSYNPNDYTYVPKPTSSVYVYVPKPIN